MSWKSEGIFNSENNIVYVVGNYLLLFIRNSDHLAIYKVITTYYLYMQVLWDYWNYLQHRYEYHLVYYKVFELSTLHK